MFNVKLPRGYIPVSVVLFLVLVLSEWIQSAIPYGTAFILFNIFLIVGRIFSEIWLVAGGIGLGLARAVVCFKCLRAPRRFSDKLRVVRWIKSAFCVLAAMIVYLIGQYLTNFILGSSNFGYYVGVWLGSEFSLFLLWEWVVRRGFHNRFKKLTEAVYE
jgi:hypothetical protein